MKPASYMVPAPLDRILQGAETARARMDFHACIGALEKANHLAPDNTTILLQLGRVHGLRYDYAAAESCFDQAIRLASGKAEMLAAAAECCLDFRDQTLPERFLRRAQERPDARPQIAI